MKIIFLDADGTLFHHSGYIPETALQACKKAQENGHKVCLCTGRQRAELFGDLLKIQYDGIIAGSGASILIQNNTIAEFTFTKEELKKAHSYLEEHAIPAMYESPYGLAGSLKTKKEIEKLLETQCAHLSESEFKKHGLYHVMQVFEIVEDPTTLPINKISFLSSNTSYQTIYQNLCSDFDLVHATFAPFGNESGEISSKHITKATGMEVLMQHFHVDSCDTIAIGDGDNDLCMFEKAGLSIAMGNAKPSVKEKADRITTCLEENGIYNAFKDLNLI